MDINTSIQQHKTELEPFGSRLVAVSKTKPAEKIQEAYDGGQRIFGENKVQELVEKHEVLPHDIEWHMIGHLQSNKVKYIAPFVSLIHAVDSIKLLKEINKQALKNGRTIECLLQIKIAEEDSKFGLSIPDLALLMDNKEVHELSNVKVVGLMGMATNTHDEEKVKAEFDKLNTLYKKLQSSVLPTNFEMKELSIGMSGDYKIALRCGSTMVRIGSAIFGKRNNQ